MGLSWLFMIASLIKNKIKLSLNCTRARKSCTRNSNHCKNQNGFLNETSTMRKLIECRPTDNNKSSFFLSSLSIVLRFKGQAMSSRAARERKWKEFRQRGIYCCTVRLTFTRIFILLSFIYYVHNFKYLVTSGVSVKHWTNLLHASFTHCEFFQNLTFHSTIAINV